jgi:hypothetical protein
MSSIQPSQVHKDAAVTLWLTHSGRPGSEYTPAESSRVESCPTSLDAACFIFVSQTSMIGRNLFVKLRNTRQITTPRVVNSQTASHFDDDVHNNKNKSNSNNTNNVLIVIRCSVYCFYILFLA